MNNTVKVPLKTKLKRGDKEIKQVEVREPVSGELRGLAIVDLVRMEVSALIKVLPRITQPTLTEQEVAALHPADLTALGMEISGFLSPADSAEESPAA